MSWLKNLPAKMVAVTKRFATQIAHVLPLSVCVLFFVVGKQALGVLEQMLTQFTGQAPHAATVD
jgi:hypothetical protein